MRCDENGNIYFGSFSNPVEISFDEAVCEVHDQNFLPSTLPSSFQLMMIILNTRYG